MPEYFQIPSLQVLIFIFEDKKLVRFDWFVNFTLRDKSNFEILEGFLFELLKEDICIFEILDGESNKKIKTYKFNRVVIL